MNALWQHWIVVASWIAWEIYWGVSARGVKRAASQEPWSSRGPVLAALFLGVLLLLAPDLFGSFMGTSFTEHELPLFLIGLAVQLAGLGFAVWARKVLGRNWSGRITVKEDHELVTTGPYALVRHPIYTGALFAVLGSALAVGQVGSLFGFLLLLGVVLRKIHVEEQVMGEHFGAEYVDYRRSTNALLPFIF